MNDRNTPPVASIIIPAWNGSRYLPACLDALLAQTCPGFEIIVVDNASSDGSADLVAARCPQVRLIRMVANLGFAGACNAGLQAALADTLVLLNQDTRVRPGWLEALLAAFQNARLGVAGCKILSADGLTLQHAGSRIEWPLGLAFHDGQGAADDGKWDEARQVEFVTGAAMALRRQVLDRVGLLDEQFWPGYFEDSDYCLRARQAGFEIWYVPQAVLVHEETTSLHDPATISRAFHRGRLRFLLKYLPPHRFLEEFVPAEQTYQQGVAPGKARNTLQMAYLEAIPMAASLLPRLWHADVALVNRVLAALQQLYRIPHGGSMSFIPSLQEFEFRSAAPVIGPLVASLRSLWYRVAARWAIRHLIQQQEAINQQQDMYMRSLILLSQEVAQLIVERDPDTKRDQPPGVTDDER